MLECDAAAACAVQAAVPACLSSSPYGFMCNAGSRARDAGWAAKSYTQLFTYVVVTRSERTPRHKLTRLEPALRYGGTVLYPVLYVHVRKGRSS